MKATFDEKQMMREYLRQMLDMAYDLGSTYIENGTIDESMCPVKVFQVVTETTAKLVELTASKVTDLEKNEMGEEIIDKYIKIDYDGKDE